MNLEFLGLAPGNQPERQPWTAERLVQERATCLSLAYEASTRDAYASAIRSYLAFCQSHGRSADPTEDTLSFYITFM
jgi:hypothetical protein